MDRRVAETLDEEEEDAITLAQLSKSPMKKPKLRASSSSSSSARTKVLKGKEENVKKWNSDVQIKFVVSSRIGSSSSSKPSTVTNDASWSSGQARSSAVIRAQEVLSNLESEFPSFVKSLVRSHVASCFWMGLPRQFCKSHLPDKDVTVTLEDENGKQWGIKYIAYKTGLSAGWRQFAVAHKLLEGDVLVFQLVQATKFKVYIIRANDLTEVDGALGLLNLDSHMKHNEPEQHKAEMDIEACDNTNKKRPKSLPLSVVQKKKKRPVLPKPAPKPTDQSENDSEEVGSEVLGGSKLSSTKIQFQEVKNFDNFSIIADGLLLDSDLPDDIKRAYYNLCRSQNAFLHESVIKGMNKKLILGTISETVSIANAIKACKVTTSRDDFATWDKSLRAFELLGMNVGFLRARLSQLSGIACESEMFLDVTRYAKSRIELKKIETKLAELKEACDRFGATMQSLGSQAESYEHQFIKKVTALW